MTDVTISTSRGDQLLTGDKVRIAGAHGIWTLLPRIPGDEARWLGRADGSLVPVVPEFEYERVAM